MARGLDAYLGSGGDPRTQALRALGIASPGKAHELITTGIKHGAGWLLRRGLNALKLTDLGYTVEGMRRLGSSEELLSQLGYREARPFGGGGDRGGKGETGGTGQTWGSAEANGGTIADKLRALVDRGAKASELAAKGFTIAQVKKIGLSSMELAHLGYGLAEMVQVCTIQELKRADFGPRELRRYFDGSDQRRAGFTADEMRLAGYGVRDLLRFGYPENQVRSAGFSTSDLLREGLSRTTRI
jgi:hypothetical protein